MNGFVRRTLICALALSVVGAAGWFGRKAYQHGKERRLIGEAGEFMARKDLRNASLCLQRALQVNPLNPESSRLMGEVLDAVGSPTALNWRIRTAQLQPDQVEHRLAWAQTAISMRKPQSASDALNGIPEKARNTAAFHKLAGALAWNLKRPSEAEQHYLAASRLEPQDAFCALNLATVRLTSPDAARAASARLQLQQFTTNAALRLVALRHLTADALFRKSIPQALAFSARIVCEPVATTGDRINHLQLLRESNDAGFAACLNALEQEATNSPIQAFALARWLATSENPAAALNWLLRLPASTQTNQPVPLIISDCQVMLKDWKGLLTLVTKQDWADANYYRLALDSLARRSLGQDSAARSSWQKSLRLATRHLDRLNRLSEITLLWGWPDERGEVLRGVLDAFPKEKWAADALISQLYAQGKTQQLKDVLEKLYAQDSANAQVGNNLANVLLLQNSDLPRAHQLSRVAYEQQPGDPFFASTHAYSLMLQGRQVEAMRILAVIKTNHLEIPGIAAYYGTVQAHFGHKESALAALRRTEAAPLLPEEKEMVRLAKARL
ncbi:MAG: hypothetical protein H7Y43_02395 [Akkermansiaceae bacterium]|nr:hypothetical protein [Verrucomicrobiales bacterium]